MSEPDDFLSLDGYESDWGEVMSFRDWMGSLTARNFAALAIGRNPPEWNMPLGWDERDAKI